jgi:acylphosphatase
VAAAVEAKRFYVSGMVQGVGYRYFAERAAGRAGVTGYVKNLRDGRVEVYAIGAPEQLRALRAELERGPRAAEVSGVAEEDARVEPRYASGFSIEFDAW